MNEYFLQTERLGFRQWTAQDLPLATALWTDPNVMGYMGGVITPAEASHRLDLQIEHQRESGYQYWPIFALADNSFAGCAGLRPYREDPRELEAGVHLAKNFWSGRYGEEAARAVIAYGFNALSLNKIIVRHHPHNANSRALVQRLGFIYSHDEYWHMGGFAAATYIMSRDEAAAAQLI